MKPKQIIIQVFPGVGSQPEYVGTHFEGFANPSQALTYIEATARELKKTIAQERRVTIETPALPAILINRH